MGARTQKIVVHTDILLDHLAHRPPGRSVLREVMSRMFVYTTVFNAIELFALARTKEESRTVEEALSALKILGLNAKHAPRYGDLFASQARGKALDLLTAGLCLESKLPLLTSAPGGFRAIRGLVVVTPAELRDRHKAAGS